MQTATQRRARSIGLRPVVLAAVLTLLLAGAAFAAGRLGLWEFINSYGRRDVPAATAPQMDVVEQSASSGDYILTVNEAYCEGRTVTILAQLAQRGEKSNLTEQLPWEGVYVQMEDGRYLEALDEQQNIGGASYHMITCTLPEDAPEEVKLTLKAEWYVDEGIPFTVSRRSVSDYSAVEADHMALAGTGITFTDFEVETTALNRTLVLRYTFDPDALTEPGLPSQYRTYYVCGDGLYHTDPQCVRVNGAATEAGLKEIVRDGLTACAEKDCDPFAEAWEPLPDGVYFELLDAEGELLSAHTIESMPALAGGSEVYETGILLDGLPETIQLRAYDCWTKYRWEDTITLNILE